MPESRPVRKEGRRRRVALVIETSTSYGRRLLEGVVRFRRLHRDWSVFLEQRDLTARPPAWLETWSGHGIISRATTRQLAEAVQASGVPLVELTDRGSDLGFPCVRSDDRAIGEQGARHLHERGFRHLAFCGFTGEAWSGRREAGFADEAAKRSPVERAYHSRWHGTHARPWEDEQKRLAEWLRDLPKPVGILCCNDMRGQHVLEACASVGLVVPEEVAVLGVDNDEILCQLCDPPLSSVLPGAESVGFRAAEILAGLMDGGRPETLLTEVPPIGIVGRQSTDVVAVEDRHVAAALSFIREHGCSGISVDDVLRAVPISRSTLERQLRRFLNRSPQQEIRHVQIKRARELLTDTELPLHRIASLCGFRHAEYLHVVFRRIAGMNPGEYRRRFSPDAR